MTRPHNLKVVETVRTGKLVPSLSDVSPEYAKLLAKRRELQSRKADLDQERKEIEKRTYSPEALDKPDRAVAVLLGDAIDDVPVSDDKERCRQITTMLRDVERALQMLEERIAAERRSASKIVCDEVRATYNERVKSLCRSLLELHQKHAELLEITDSLDRHNVAWLGRLHPMRVQFIGSPNDTYGPMAHYLKEAIEHGFIDKSEFPDSLRTKAPRRAA